MGGQVLDYEAKRIFKEGEARGEARGEAKVNLLHSILLEAERFDDLKRSTKDAAFQAKLMAELLPAV